MQLCMEKLKMELYFGLKLETHLSFVNNFSDINLFLSLLNCVYMHQREGKEMGGEEEGGTGKEKKNTGKGLKTGEGEREIYEHGM